MHQPHKKIHGGRHTKRVDTPPVRLQQREDAAQRHGLQQRSTGHRVQNRGHCARRHPHWAYMQKKTTWGKETEEVHSRL